MSDRIRSLSELGKLFPGASGTDAAVPKKGLTPPGRSKRSVEIRNPDRAGRAPYNFVPLAREWRAVDPPATLETYAGLSGQIELRIEALTPFYVRGMRSLEDFRKAPRNAKGKIEPTPDPFRVASRLRLPGSSLRGMVRNLVEIIGKAPLDPVNDTQLFFRAVGSVPNPDNRGSFEPQAIVYKERIGGGDRSRPDTGLKVHVGFLSGGRDQWFIHPAKDQTWYRVEIEEDRPDEDLYRFWCRKQVYFQVYDASHRRAKLCRQGERDARRGMLIASGDAPKKRWQWIVLEEDPSKSIEIPRADVEAYEEAGQVQIHEVKQQPNRTDSRKKEDKETLFRFTRESEHQPCFYVLWTENDQTRHVSFGHTPHFKLPYKNTVSKAIPPENFRHDPKPWDLAQAIFGRAPSREHGIQGQRSRVFFEDAFQQREAPLDQERRAVLGQPKPTTYQHYLVQNSETLADSIHWDGDCRGPRVQPMVRGHKLYWHRPNAVPRAVPQGQEAVSTRFRAGKACAVFIGRVRYENLNETELGALLTTLALPQGCAHRLGMAKPLGYGSFKITITALHHIDRNARYAAFTTPSLTGSQLAGGTEDITGSIASYQQAFARWYLEGHGDLWEDERMRDLKALLTFESLPPDWLDRTRYLEFGKLDRDNFNEYTHVSRQNLSKRRSLPPARQVLEDPLLPSEPRPRFRD